MCLLLLLFYYWSFLIIFSAKNGKESLSADCHSIPEPTLFLSLSLLTRIGDAAPVAAVGQTQPGGHPASSAGGPDQGLQGAGGGLPARVQSERPGGGRARLVAPPRGSWHG